MENEKNAKKETQKTNLFLFPLKGIAKKAYACKKNICLLAKKN